MKELTIEEKAKAYDEAIELAKEINNEQRAQPFDIMTRVFPELAESKDERIRKELLNAFQESEDSLYMVLTPQRRKSFIAWLEKVVTPTPQDWNDYKDKPVVLWNAYVQGVANGMERGKEAVENHPQDYGLEKQGHTFTKKDVDDAYLKGVCNTKQELEKQGDKSVNIDIESMVSSYKQRLKSQGGIENSPLVNMCLTAFRHGVENTLEELNLKKLEKQGEKKLTEKYNIRGIKSKHAEGKLGEMIKEMKSTDKVEPKFKKD